MGAKLPGIDVVVEEVGIGNLAGSFEIRRDAPTIFLAQRSPNIESVSLCIRTEI
ncbi:MAG: hypothetical protein IPL58_01230 [Betaproteobacteria bacterium]|uniref:Uncharacterized protein n=1 Tax=Candidatus Proximibacter danicus TaxID=2954365 RepID=A0A9D7K025_9PROT|nr:hypothetical protein [Candidatus Proximibacter danicus]